MGNNWANSILKHGHESPSLLLIREWNEYIKISTHLYCIQRKIRRRHSKKRVKARLCFHVFLIQTIILLWMSILKTNLP